MPAPDVDLLVISDIDDTVLETGAQRLLDMIRVTATNSALTRTAFPGVPELYRAMEAWPDGPSRPFFHVSSSPWNLDGFLRGFLTHREIPLGPLLRDLGIDESKLGRPDRHGGGRTHRGSRHVMPRTPGVASRSWLGSRAWLTNPRPSPVHRRMDLPPTTRLAWATARPRTTVDPRWPPAR